MKLSKILSKRVLSLLIVGLFVFTAFAVIQSGGNQAQASPSAVNSFTFPYQYGTPTVPSDVGAQGIQGPTVPLGDIGAKLYGPSGHVGPYNTSQQSFYANISTPGKHVTNVTINVFNGTLQSHTPSIGATVTIISDYTGNWQRNVTASTGITHVSGIQVGWNYIVVGVQSTYINFSEQTCVTPNYALNVYLIPRTYSVTSINNGPAADLGNYWVTSAYGELLSNSISPFFSGSQLNISVLNNSDGNVVLGTAVTLYNGSVEFTGLNSAYNYEFEVIGYRQGLSGVKYGYVNETSGVSGGPTPGTTTLIRPLGVTMAPSTTTGTVTGTAMPVSGSWTITTPTIINHGVTYLNYSSMSGSKTNTLTIKNGTIYVNTNSFGTVQSLPIIIDNSTLILSAYVSSAAIEDITSNNSIVIDSANGMLFSQPFAGMPAVPINFVYLNLSNSILFGLSESAGSSMKSGIISNSVLSHIQIPQSANYWKVVHTTNNVPFAGNITDSYVENSSIGFLSHVNLTSVQVVNSTIFPTHTYANVVSSYFTNSSITNPGGYFYDSNFTDDTFISSGGVNVSYDSIYTGISPNSTEPNTGYLLGVNAIVNKSFITMKIPEWTPGFITITNGSVTDSIISFNTTGSDIVKWDSLSRRADNLPPGIMFAMNFNDNGNTTFSHNQIYGVMLELQSNDTIQNNVFSNYNYGQFMIGPNGNNPLGNTIIRNNTFNGADFNLSDILQVSGYNAVNPNEYIFGPGYNPVYINTIGVSGSRVTSGNVTLLTHNTFNVRLVGVLQASSDIIQGNFSDVSDNVFYNDQTYGNQYFALPYSILMNINNPSPTISGNYFLNLNNYTVPIVVSSDRANMSNNHFYYSPYPGTSSVSIGKVTSTDNWPDFPHTYDQLTYGYLVEKGSVSFSGSQYAFNSSVTFDQNLSAYIYSVAPDVNTLSGTPIISYSNGLVGGPQPNFIWKGYNYSESVEPSYIQVGVNSSKAPSIGLQFQGIAGALYDIEMFNNGSLISSYQESATSLGVLNATYNPTTMPLDPVFYVEYIGSGVTPPPVIVPLVPIVPHVLFGIPYLNVIVLFGGIALASEEFFRTQTKGNEKKYSYTGVFVGIMIAGIGLMSVL